MECSKQTSFSAQQMTGCSPRGIALGIVCQRKYDEWMLCPTVPWFVFWVFSDASERVREDLVRDPSSEVKRMMGKEHALMLKPNWHSCQLAPFWWTEHSSHSGQVFKNTLSAVPWGTSPNTVVYHALREVLTLDITVLWAESPENGEVLGLWRGVVVIPVSKKHLCDLPTKPPI